jgi:hypothetical protein
MIQANKFYRDRTISTENVLEMHNLNIREMAGSVSNGLRASAKPFVPQQQVVKPAFVACNTAVNAPLNLDISNTIPTPTPIVSTQIRTNNNNNDSVNDGYVQQLYQPEPKYITVQTPNQVDHEVKVSPSTLTNNAVNKAREPVAVSSVSSADHKSTIIMPSVKSHNKTRLGIKHFMDRRSATNAAVTVTFLKQKEKSCEICDNRITILKSDYITLTKSDMNAPAHYEGIRRNNFIRSRCEFVHHLKACHNMDSTQAESYVKQFPFGLLPVDCDFDYRKAINSKKLLRMAQQSTIWMAQQSTIGIPNGLPNGVVNPSTIGLPNGMPQPSTIKNHSLSHPNPRQSYSAAVRSAASESVQPAKSQLKFNSQLNSRPNELQMPPLEYVGIGGHL